MVYDICVQQKNIKPILFNGVAVALYDMVYLFIVNVVYYYGYSPEKLLIKWLFMNFS